MFVPQTDPNNQFVAAILYQATTSTVGDVNGWTADPCKRTDTLYRDTLDGNFKFPACLLVNHIINLSDQRTWRTPSDAKAYEWFEDRKVELPYSVIASAYTKYGSGDFVSAQVFLNPDAAGIEPAAEASWLKSPRHPRLLPKDPQRVAYIEKVKAWDSVFVASVKE